MNNPNPYASPSRDRGDDGDADGHISAALEPLARRSGWLTFMAVLTFIYAGFCVLSIWGILVAWLPIWVGVVMIQASGAAKRAVASNSLEDAKIATGKLGFMFMLWGIVTIVSLALMLVVMMFGIGSAIMAANGR